MTGRAPFGLTGRHVKIIELCAEGMSNAQIGRKLFISELTVNSQMATIGKRMGCGDRAGIVGLAYRTGILAVRRPPAEQAAQAAADATWAELLLIHKAAATALRRIQDARASEAA